MVNQPAGDQSSSVNVTLCQRNRSSVLGELNQRLLQPIGKPVLVNSSDSFNASAELILELAWEISKKGLQRVLIVDCNLRTPILSRAYKLSRGAGLAEFLLGTHTVREIVKKTNLANVHLVCSGECFVEPVTLLTSLRLPQLIATAANHYDLVLLNTPPYHAYIDTFALAKFLQPATLVLVSDNEMGIETKSRALSELQVLDLDIVDVVSQA